MFCTVKRTKNKYAVYLSERVRENGKVKSKDKYIFSLEPQEIENGTYEERLSFSALTDEEQKIIMRKLGSMEVTLHDTTEHKPLHTTTGARVEFEIEVTNDTRCITYNFYVGDVLIYDLCDFQFEVMKLGKIMISIGRIIEEKGITDKETIAILREKTIDIYEYYDELKKKREAERAATASYYENTIFALRLKIAELQNNSGNTSLHATTNPMKVKKLYRALASKLHPDNGGSDELMQMLNELKDMVK